MRRYICIYMYILNYIKQMRESCYSFMVGASAGQSGRSCGICKCLGLYRSEKKH